MARSVTGARSNYHFTGWIFIVFALANLLVPYESGSSFLLRREGADLAWGAILAVSVILAIMGAACFVTGKLIPVEAVDK